MRIDVKDLPLSLQKQALRKLREEDKKRSSKELEIPEEKPAQRSSKYNARKVTVTMDDGTEHTFDSRHEAQVYGDLWLRQQAGEISGLKLQVPFVLIPKQEAPSGKKYRECKYIADFVFFDQDGKMVVQDAKGFRTKEYQLKKKLMLEKWGIEIEEV